MGDGRSKLAKLKKRLERELCAQYPPKTELDRMKIEQAAQLRALAKVTGSTLGSDPRSTPGRFGKLVRTADGTEARLAEQHARLEELGGGRCKVTPQALLASMRRVADG